MTIAFEQTPPSDYLTRLAASNLGRGYKALVVRELDIEPGHTVLDLGCGPGADLQAFAESVGPSGAVIGLDNDEEVTEQARQAVAGLPTIDVRMGDIHHLDLPSGSIDRAHTDRVLQHVADPSRVLAEVHRVLAADGCAALAEPDWDTLVIDFPRPEVAEAYRRFITDRVVRNSRIGRQLPRLAKAVGLTVTRIVPVTAVFRDANEADKIFGFHRVTQRAVAAEYLTPADADEWLAYLASAPFFASTTLFVVVARRRRKMSATERTRRRANRTC